MLTLAQDNPHFFLIYLPDKFTKEFQEKVKSLGQDIKWSSPEAVTSVKKFYYMCQLWLTNDCQDYWVKLQDWSVMSAMDEGMDTVPHVPYILFSWFSSICCLLFLGMPIKQLSLWKHPTVSGHKLISYPLEEKQKLVEYSKMLTILGFPGGAVVGSLPANAGDTGSGPGLGRSTCRGATRPVSHNCWACASGACARQQERPR